MQPIRRRTFALAALALAACRRGAALDLEGRPTDPLAARAPATVLVFVASTCPISNRYAPELARLHGLYAPRGAAFYLVYAHREDTADVARAHARDYAYPFPALLDPARALVDASGATTTPEVALFGPDGALAYRGRIDDRVVAFGQERPAPEHRDLADALDAVLSGRPVTTKRTRAIGCAIPPAR